jgi:hypothetical protein
MSCVKQHVWVLHMAPHSTAMQLLQPFLHCSSIYPSFKQLMHLPACLRLYARACLHLCVLCTCLPDYQPCLGPQLLLCVHAPAVTQAVFLPVCTRPLCYFSGRHPCPGAPPHRGAAHRTGEAQQQQQQQQQWQRQQQAAAAAAAAAALSLPAQDFLLVLHACWQ